MKFNYVSEYNEFTRPFVFLRGMRKMLFAVSRDVLKKITTRSLMGNLFLPLASFFCTNTRNIKIFITKSNDEVFSFKGEIPSKNLIHDKRKLFFHICKAPKWKKKTTRSSKSFPLVNPQKIRLRLFEVSRALGQSIFHIFYVILCDAEGIKLCHSWRKRAGGGGKKFSATQQEKLRKISFTN